MFHTVLAEWRGDTTLHVLEGPRFPTSWELVRILQQPRDAEVHVHTLPKRPNNGNNDDGSDDGSETEGRR